MRPKIFALLSNNRTLPMTGGDKINESRFYRALSQHFDVYYNGQLFDPNAKDFGIKDRPIEIPKDEYDLYYVRANNKVLYHCPRPKVAMGVPYSKWLYNHADAILTTTEQWKSMILGYNQDQVTRTLLKDWYEGSSSIVIPKKVINIRQTIDPNFGRYLTTHDIMMKKISYNLKPTFGFFGSLAMQIFPHNAISALLRLQREYDINICMAGKKYTDTVLPNGIRYLGYLPYNDTLLSLKACTCLIANEGEETEYLGSGKVLDAIAAGVPILAYRSAVREEQLGGDYLGFYKSEEEAYFIAKMIIENSYFREQIIAQMSKRYDIYSVSAQGDYLYEQFKPLLR